MKKVLVVSNVLFASATMFYANACTNAFNPKMYDNWEIVRAPVVQKSISADWQVVHVPNSDEKEFFDAREDFEDSDVFFDARSYDNYEMIDTIGYSGPSEKENRKKYNRFETLSISSLVLEDKQGKTETVFFYDIDNSTNDLTSTNRVNSGFCSTAIEAIATSQQSQSFIQELHQSCSLAYDSQDRFKDSKKVGSSGNITPFYKDEEYMGIVRQVEDRLIVSFPGTRFGRKEGVGDTIKDIKFLGSDGRYSSLQGVSTHAAFSKDVMEVFDAMIEIIKSKSGNASEIWFTGHSKGGGEAILAAYKFALYVKTKIGDDNVLSKFREKNRIKVFAFSAPGVVNEKGRELLYDLICNQNIICVHKKPDVVTKVTDYPGFVPVGVRMKMEKPKTKSYVAGLFSSHSLDNFGESEYEKIVNMARYVNAKYDPKPVSDACRFFQNVGFNDVDDDYINVDALTGINVQKQPVKKVRKIQGILLHSIKTGNIGELLGRLKIN